MGDLRGQFMALHAVPLTNGAVFKHSFETPFTLQISRNFGFGTVLVGTLCMECEGAGSNIHCCSFPPLPGTMHNNGTLSFSPLSCAPRLSVFFCVCGVGAHVQRFWMRNALRNTKVIVADEIKLPARCVCAVSFAAYRCACQLVLLKVYAGFHALR